MAGFDKIEDYYDDDIVVSEAVTNRPISVIELVSRLMALNQNCIYYQELVSREPTEENMQLYAVAYDKMILYSERLYSPLI